ncbi:hypothetical protein F9B85_13720 [Heliorestis acidaminivorans]|uniref:Citrate transporter-like domain-containing protein n=1 Tax=Heliorestis acidaminivorans TaxID=553427 RepID=A0A6I0ETZ1_9FIRM|nr:hypothetical protein [Heliorestis acidaminivorans]KAB2950943.1 hypothetical protein F9B85_13720 [Heliorestis acidaminivorans]
MKTICKIALFLLAGIHLIKPFVPVDFTILLFITTLLVLGTGIVLMGQGFRIITFVFLILGVGLLLFYGQPFEVWISSINALTNVVAIVAIMQLFAIPIAVGQYDRVVRYWITKSSQGERGLFLITTAGTQFLTSLLMFGSIPVMIAILGDTLKNCVSNYQRFVATATVRGYGLAALWAPGAINLFLVMQATGVYWSDIVLPGFLLGILGIFISYLLERKVQLSSQNYSLAVEDNQQKVSPSEAQKKSFFLVFVLICLGLLIFLFDQLAIGTSSNRVVMAVALVTFLWTILHFRNPALTRTLKQYWDHGALKTVDLGPFLVAMGLFSGALEHSGLITELQSLLQIYINSLGIFAIFLIPFLMIVASLVGIHPFITIVMFGKILIALHLPISDVTLALCLALGGSLSYIISPFAGVTIALSNYVDAKVWDVTIRWNWLFVAIYFIVGVSFAYFWGTLIR